MQPYLHEKKVVEYTFKNSLSEIVQTIILNKNHLILQFPEGEIVVSYEQIKAVHLSKANDTFKITIIPSKQRPIAVTNKYYLPNGSCEDRSRQYTAFVRVLHYHLNSQSKPIYSSGFSLSLLAVWALVFAFISFFVSFVSEYLGLSLMNPYAQALALTMLLTGGLFLLRQGKLPKTYSPTEIPYQFLP